MWQQCVRCSSTLPATSLSCPDCDLMLLPPALFKHTPPTQMPPLFKTTGQNVGGCNDGPGVMTLHKEGKLVPLLKQAGALA